MTTFWFEDSWTVHRLVAVEAESEEAARDKLVDQATWLYEETNDSDDYGEWEVTSPEAFHDDWPKDDNDVWTKEGFPQLEKREVTSRDLFG